jgi:hypothetical protein
MCRGAGVIEGLRTVLDEVVDRLLRAPESRLTGSGPDGRTAACAGHELAQWLADAAAGVEQRAAGVAPESRAVPWLGPFVVAHQVAVTAADLVAACAGLGAEDSVWAGGVRRELGAVLAAGEAHVLGVRQRL